MSVSPIAIINPSPFRPTLNVIGTLPDLSTLRHMIEHEDLPNNLLTNYACGSYMVNQMIAILQHHKCGKVYIVSLGGVDHLLLHQDLKDYISATFYSVEITDDLIIKEITPYNRSYI